jgi:ureidoglycolate lyase
MKTVRISPLTEKNFAPFGCFYAMETPDGFALQGALHRFFPDRLLASCGGNVGFSPILVKKPAEMVITQAEYHTTTWEAILPLNDDMILHVAPPSGGEYPAGWTKAFLVPKHTLVRMNAGVWHLCPLPAHAEELAAMIVLPECTYANDCTVVDLPADAQFRIQA